MVVVLLFFFDQLTLARFLMRLQHHTLLHHALLQHDALFHRHAIAVVGMGGTAARAGRGCAGRSSVHVDGIYRIQFAECGCNRQYLFHFPFCSSVKY